MLSFPAQRSSAPNRSTAEQRPMSGPFSSESRRGNGKRLSSWNDPVVVHGVSPYTSANRSFKEAVPQKQFVNIPFCRVSRVLHHWVNSVHSRRHIAHSNHSALDHQPGLYVWGGTHGTNYPTDTNGLLRVDEG